LPHLRSYIGKVVFGFQRGTVCAHSIQDVPVPAKLKREEINRRKKRYNGEEQLGGELRKA
jgi:hypothetical protein